VQARKSLPDPAVAVQEKFVGGEEVSDVVVDFRVDEHSAQNSFFRLAVVGDFLT
jgi:hypothetical protein